MQWTIYHSDDYLAHHGRKNQKWGVRNGPPYPLNAEGNKSFKRNQDIIKKYAKDPTKRIDKGLAESINGKQASSYVYGEDRNIVDGYEARFVRDANGNIVYSTHTPTSTLASYGRRNVTNASTPYSQRTGIDDDDLRECNPGYRTSEVGTTNNCTKCTAALWMRDHGYSDVQAGRILDQAGASSFAMEYWFDNAKLLGVSGKRATYDSIKTTLESEHTPGKCGTIAGYRNQRNGGGGHIAYWRVNEYGDFEVCDGQSGKRYSSLDSFFDAEYFDRSLGVHAYDLSDARPNFEHMKEDGVLRREVPVRFVNDGYRHDSPGSGAYDRSNDSVYNLYDARVRYGQDATRLAEVYRW